MALEAVKLHPHTLSGESGPSNTAELGASDVTVGAPATHPAPGFGHGIGVGVAVGVGVGVGVGEGCGWYFMVCPKILPCALSTFSIVPDVEIPRFSLPASPTNATFDLSVAAS